LDDFVDEKGRNLFSYTADRIDFASLHPAYYRYETTMVEGNVIKPVETKVQFRTDRKVPKVRRLYRVVAL
jgi:hypothetical protein